MKNPQRALDAITASGKPVASYTVREITLGLAGVLEKIMSPLVTGRKPEHIIEWAPSLYAMTHSTAECEKLLAGGRKAFEAAAYAWADTVPLAEAKRMLDSAMEAGKRLAEVSDEGEDDTSEGAAGNAGAATGG